MPIEIKAFRGNDLKPYLKDLASLRIGVFREYPYLYDGSISYEERYLEKYANCPESVVGVAFENGNVVGMTTALPLVDADEDFQKPFHRQSISIERIFYFGESVVRKASRGQGTGGRFFDLREGAALDWGAETTCFCAVERPSDHPLKPNDYRSNDAFWQRRGYMKRPDLQCAFDWKQVDTDSDVSNTLTFWTKLWN